MKAGRKAEPKKESPDTENPYRVNLICFLLYDVVRDGFFQLRGVVGMCDKL